MIRVAINGYGRIGRLVHRIILEKLRDKIQIVAINTGSSTDVTGWMYLLKYDTSYGVLKGLNLSVRNGMGVTTSFLGHLIIDAEEIPVYSEKKLLELPWKLLDVDIVIESTGIFLIKEELMQHITAGAKRVILSAPFKNPEDVGTYVIGVNKNPNGTRDDDKIISNASCTTNCISPVAQIIEEHFGIEKAMMTTIHAVTSDQRLHDSGHKDYRRARAAGHNIVPTSSGATRTMGNILPSLKSIFGGVAFRVPVLTGSLSDFTFLLKTQSVTKEEINKIFEQSSEEGRYKNILTVTKEPIVSSDVIGDHHSSIVDLSLTQVVGGNMVKVVAWYDNEYAYAHRLVDMILL